MTSRRWVHLLLAPLLWALLALAPAHARDAGAPADGGLDARGRRRRTATSATPGRPTPPTPRGRPTRALPPVVLELDTPPATIDTQIRHLAALAEGKLDVAVEPRTLFTVDLADPAAVTTRIATLRRAIAAARAQAAAPAGPPRGRRPAPPAPTAARPRRRPCPPTRPPASRSSSA
ncbi:MAG: hypothetical protein H6704_25985 [Myxococcales bacterium]|nr:hypothetical protein [Myxococcales bacterium]